MMKKAIYIIICVLFSALGVSEVAAQTDRQLIRQGNRQFHTQQLEKAEATYRKAVAANQRNPEAQYNLGCVLMAQQKDSMAVQCFETAAKLQTDPLRRAQAYHNIGVICQQKKMFSEAIEAYKESLRNNPADNETRYNLALCLKQQKNQPKNKNQQQQKQDQNKDQNKDKKDQDKDKNKDQNKDQQQQKQPEQMSKENAEQLLNAAIQQEKNTQQRLQKAKQQPRHNRHQKNW